MHVHPFRFFSGRVEGLYLRVGRRFNHGHISTVRTNFNYTIAVLNRAVNVLCIFQNKPSYGLKTCNRIYKK